MIITHSYIGPEGLKDAAEDAADFVADGKQIAFAQVFEKPGHYELTVHDES